MVNKTSWKGELRFHVLRFTPSKLMFLVITQSFFKMNVSD
jgi:hypothetical protein